MRQQAENVPPAIPVPLASRRLRRRKSTMGEKSSTARNVKKERRFTQFAGMIGSGYIFFVGCRPEATPLRLQLCRPRAVFARGERRARKSRRDASGTKARIAEAT